MAPKQTSKAKSSKDGDHSAATPKKLQSESLTEQEKAANTSLSPPSPIPNDIFMFAPFLNEVKSCYFLFATFPLAVHCGNTFKNVYLDCALFLVLILFNTHYFHAFINPTIPPSLYLMGKIPLNLMFSIFLAHVFVVLTIYPLKCILFPAHLIVGLPPIAEGTTTYALFMGEFLTTLGVTILCTLSGVIFDDMSIQASAMIVCSIKLFIEIGSRYGGGVMNGLIATAYYFHKNGGPLNIMNSLFFAKAGEGEQQQLWVNDMNNHGGSSVEFFLVYVLSVFAGNFIGIAVTFVLVDFFSKKEKSL